jgi:aminoglycoside/choline kinase family phosphotransferase
MAALYGLYRCEVNFYAHAARSMKARTPRCYFGDVNEAGTEFVLLLEDLGANGTLGDQVAGCTLEHAKLALREVARVHASWWGSPELAQMTWLPLGTDLLEISMTQAYPPGWQACMDIYGAKIPPEVRAVADGLNERMLKLFSGRDDMPLTLMHADYRLDNMFFGNQGSGYDLAIIDWQIVNRGWAAYDVAYFLTSNLERDVRQAHQRELVRLYHDELVSQGVRGYSFDDCWLHYRESALAYLANMIGNAASLDTANERGVELFDMILGRASQTVLDLDALALLP